MRTTIIRLVALMIPLFLTTACLFEEEDLFDKSSALRMDEEIKADIALLTAAPKGWLVDYYPESDYSMGGYAMHWKFMTDGTVTVACEAEVNGVPVAEVATSLWDVKPEQAPVLSFDTYNKVLQYFCEPSQADITGLGGDYEFIIRRNIEMGNNLVITGKRNGNRLVLRPVDADVDPATYLAQVKELSDGMAWNKNFTFYVNGDSIGYTSFSSGVAAGLTVRTIDMTVSSGDGDEGGEGSGEETTRLSFTYTPTGFRLNEPFLFRDVSMQNFSWDEEGRTFTCTDPGASMQWVCTDAGPPTFDEIFGFDREFGLIQVNNPADISPGFAPVWAAIEQEMLDETDRVIAYMQVYFVAETKLQVRVYRYPAGQGATGSVSFARIYFDLTTEEDGTVTIAYTPTGVASNSSAALRGNCDALVEFLENSRFVWDWEEEDQSRGGLHVVDEDGVKTGVYFTSILQENKAE